MQAPFVQRKARVSRSCWGWDRASSCNRFIAAGETFYQCQWRSGLARAEICTECAVKNGLAVETEEAV